MINSNSLLSCAVSKLWPIIGQISAIDREVHSESGDNDGNDDEPVRFVFFAIGFLVFCGIDWISAVIRD